MSAKWVSAVLGILVLSGCNVPKTETYKFKAPPMPNPRPSPLDEKQMEELGKQMREALKLTECKESKQTPVELSGNLDPERVKDLTGGPVERGSAQGASFKVKPDERGTLIHNGCPEEFVKAEAGDLDVVLIKDTIASAKKVMLCGKVTKSPFLTIHAAELVLKDFDFRVAGFGGVSINTGILSLEGTNKISAVAIPSGFLSFSINKALSLNVETGVQGLGTLEVDSKVVTCARVKEVDEKEKLKKETKN